MFDVHSKCALSLLLFVSFALTAALPAAACSPEDAVTIFPDDLYRGAAGGPGETFCYRIDLDSPGALIVGVAAPEGPTLRLARDVGVEVGFVLSGHGATQLALWVGKPGAYVFEAAARIPQTALGEHIFTSRFVPAVAGVMLGAEPRTKDDDDEEIDPILATTAPPDGDGAHPGVARPGLLLFDSGRQYVVRIEGKR